MTQRRRRSLHRAAALLLAAGALVAACSGFFGGLIGGWSGTAGAADASDGTRASRVLIVSLPTVTWSDVQRVHTPNLDRIFSKGAVGNLVTNGVERPAPLADAYLSLGAGARATAGAIGANSTGLGFGVEEKFGRDDAGTVFRSRTGTPPGDGIVFMDVNDVTEANDSELYGAKVGLLGDELAKAGVTRAVIANGDGTDPSVPDTRVSPYRRAAVGALMTNTGKVPAGQVDRDLLTPDPGAPFGLRLDNAAVTDAFDQVWQRDAVVLVEGSDLVRADVSGRFASETQAEKLRDQALRWTDALVGQLLDRVDLAKDLVVVVAPETHANDDSLTVAAVAGPGFAPGLLRSTTTQTDGFVNITDVAPTVLRAYGIDRPDDMEGRRMESAPNGDPLATRVERLADVNTDGLFRDSLIGASMGVVLGVACGVGLFVILLDRFPGLGFFRGLVVFAAVWELAFLDTVYLAGPLHFGRNGGRPAYWVFVLGGAFVLAALFLLVARRQPVDAILVGLGSVVAVHLVDLVTGAHLEWNTVFGYSPTIGIRFVGEGNMTFALLGAAATLFAGLFWWRVPTARGRNVAIGLLALTVVVMGAPFWGNDFGGAISAAPGFALLVWLLLGHRVRWRTLWVMVVVLVGAAVAVGLVDLLRPPDSRTHVGKFFEKAFTDFGGATLVIRRKLHENLSVLTHSLLAVCLIVALAVVCWLWFARPRSLRILVARIPTATATGLALAVVAVLGFALNDSGISIPGMMAAVFVATLAFLVARRYADPVDDGSTGALAAQGKQPAAAEVASARSAP
jgi:hypothetical protein